MRLGVLLIVMTAISFSACSGLKLRQPSAEEKRHYVFSENIDRAVIDPNEVGPLDIVPLLATDDAANFSNPFERTAKVFRRDIVRAGYDEGDQGTTQVVGDEKGQAVLIAVMIVFVVLAGAAAPILYFVLK